MDIKQKQISSDAQKIVLRTLAESVAKQGCSFLEIGSWCGESSIILGKVAQKHDGHLYCVDWWKGSIGTDLNDIALRADIFSYFWEQVCLEGLEDVIIPIRGRSDVVCGILDNNKFDLIFIDSDHRYETVLNDIECYAKLVKQQNGILCGHDCEGPITDYEMEFLEKGKNLDYFESVHCGVVLAVGQFFEKIALNHSIWSVISAGQGIWEPTNVLYPEIGNKKQSPSPPIGFTRNYILYRHGRWIYAIHRSLATALDFLYEDNIKLSGFIRSNTRQGIEQIINEEIFLEEKAPLLIETYKNYNIVFYWEYYALAKSLGDIDLTKIGTVYLEDNVKDKRIFIAKSLSEIRKCVDINGMSFPKAVLERLKKRCRVIATTNQVERNHSHVVIKSKDSH